MREFTKEIETDRLILRKFKIDDINDVFNNYASHEIVSEFLTWQPHKSIEDTKVYLSEVVLPEYEKEYTYRWAIVLKEINQVVGCIDVVKKNIDKQCVELGYVLGDVFWGKGIMPEAGRAVIKYLFEENFVRIQAIHDVENPKSGRVMQKIGMTYEGTMRKFERRRDGKLSDCKMYAIIKDDYIDKK